MDVQISLLIYFTSFHEIGRFLLNVEIAKIEIDRDLIDY